VASYVIGEAFCSLASAGGWKRGGEGITLHWDDSVRWPCWTCPIYTSSGDWCDCERLWRKGDAATQQSLEEKQQHQQQQQQHRGNRREMLVRDTVNAVQRQQPPRYIGADYDRYPLGTIFTTSPWINQQVPICRAFSSFRAFAVIEHNCFESWIILCAPRIPSFRFPGSLLTLFHLN